MANDRVLTYFFCLLFLCSIVKCFYEDNSCCNPHDTPGCSNAAIQKFVCEKSIYCCTITWDEECVQQAVSTNAFSEYFFAKATYSTLTAMPNKRYSNSATFLFVGDYLYIIGGQLSSLYGSTTTQVNSVLLTSGTASTLAPLNTARGYATATYYNGNIYVFGGVSATNSLISTYEVYNIATNKWTLGSTNLPKADYGMSTIAVPELSCIYLVGGEYNPTTFTQFEISTGYFTLFPTSKYSHLGPALSYDSSNNRLYALGGSNSEVNEYYHFSNEEWVSATLNFPTGYNCGFTNYGNYTSFIVAGSVLAAVQTGLDYAFNPVLSLPETMYSIGEYNYENNQLVVASLNYIYLVALPTVQSQTISSSMTARYALAAETVLDNLILTMGGVSKSGVSNLNQAYNTSSNEWITLAPMPTYRYGMSSVVVENKVYLFGGYDRGHKVLNTTEVYDPITNQWLALPGMPTARVYSSAAYYYGLIYVFGGFNEYMGGGLAVVEVFDVSKSNWGSYTSLPYPLYGHVSYESGGVIYIYQGKGAYLPTYAFELNPYTRKFVQFSWNVPPAFLGTVCEFNGVPFFQGGLSFYEVVPQNYNGFFYVNSTKNYFVPMERFSGTRAVGASAVAQGSCYVFGGIDSNENFLSTIDVIEISNSVC